MVVDNIIVDNTTIISRLELMETASFIAGDYTCEASNILGDTNITAALTVYGMYINWRFSDVLCSVCIYVLNCLAGYTTVSRCDFAIYLHMM